MNLQSHYDLAVAEKELGHKIRIRGREGRLRLTDPHRRGSWCVSVSIQARYFGFTVIGRCTTIPGVS